MEMKLKKIQYIVELQMFETQTSSMSKRYEIEIYQYRAGLVVCEKMSMCAINIFSVGC